MVFSILGISKSVSDYPLLRILRILFREFFDNQLPMRAAALTFSVLLSMVPLLALSTSLFKGLGNEQQIKTGIIHLIDQWEPAPRPDLERPNPVPHGEYTDQQPAVLHQAARIIFSYVDQTNFAALGIFGVLSLFISAFFVFASIENALNTIWHTAQQRSIHRKALDYLALLIFLPLSFNLVFALEALFTSESSMSRLNQIIPNVLVQILFFHVVPFLLLVCTLMLLYLFVPCKKVRPLAALLGAITGSALWVVIQKLYFVLQIGVSKYNIIYGSFASVPLFLTWLYIGWLCILFGALLSYALQHRHSYTFSHVPLTPRRIMSLAFDILLTCYHNFEHRIETTALTLENALSSFSPHDIHYVLARLTHSGFITTAHSSSRPTLVPCISSDRLLASEIITLFLGETHQVESTVGGQLSEKWLADVQASASLPFSQLLRRNEYDASAAPIHT